MRLNPKYMGAIKSLKQLNFSPKNGDIVIALNNGEYDANGMPIKENDTLYYIDGRWYIMSAPISTNREWLDRLSNRDLALFINSEKFFKS